MTTTTATTTPTKEQMYAELLAGRLEELAERLEHVATLARTVAADTRGGYPDTSDPAPYADRAGAVLDEMSMMLVKAQLGAIVTAAAEVEMVCIAESSPAKEI